MSQERANPTPIVILLLIAYITYNAKNMNPNKTALIAVWLGLIVFASMVKVFWYEWI